MTTKRTINWIEEDAPHGDITTAAIFGSKPQKSHAVILAKQDLVLSGLNAAGEWLRHEFPKVRYRCVKKDAQFVKKGTVVAQLSGSIQDLLLLERTLLNLIQHLSGIATLTAQYVALAKNPNLQILDTRKTLPGYRDLEKQAVKHGGGKNHRRDLSSQYLIKDNHIAAAGSAVAALTQAQNHRKRLGLKYAIEIEVTTLKEFQSILPLKPDIILLDNMSLKNIRKAVALRNRYTGKKPLLEISGGVNLKTLKKLANTGVERISIGALTHSAPAADLSIEITNTF